jgi:hypothetical protein
MSSTAAELEPVVQRVQAILRATSGPADHRRALYALARLDPAIQEQVEQLANDLAVMMENDFLIERDPSDAFAQGVTLGLLLAAQARA